MEPEPLWVRWGAAVLLYGAVLTVVLGIAGDLTGVRGRWFESYPSAFCSTPTGCGTVADVYDPGR